jgi:hypothetical protein
MLFSVAELYGHFGLPLPPLFLGGPRFPAISFILGGRLLLIFDFVFDSHKARETRSKTKTSRSAPFLTFVFDPHKERPKKWPYSSIGIKIQNGRLQKSLFHKILQIRP